MQLLKKTKAEGKYSNIALFYFQFSKYAKWLMTLYCQFRGEETDSMNSKRVCI